MSPLSHLDLLSEESLYAATAPQLDRRKRCHSPSPATRDTRFLVALHKKGLVDVCDRTDWTVNRDSIHRFGMSGKWDPLLAYLAYKLSRSTDRQNDFTALHLGPGNVKLLEDLAARRRSVRDVLKEIERDTDTTIIDSETTLLDEPLGDLWEHYGLANKIYMEITTILSTMISTPNHADDDTRNQFRELRRYLGLSILYRAQTESPIGIKCKEALRTKTGIFDIVLHPAQYGFTRDLTAFPVPGEFDMERNESPSPMLEKIWGSYFTDPSVFLHRYGISTDAPSLRTILTRSASHHGLILGQFESTNLPEACADLIVSVRGDSHLQDADFVNMLERTTLNALREYGVYLTDGVVGSYDRFEAMRLLGFIHAAHQISLTRQDILNTGLILRHHPRNSAHYMVQAAFASPVPKGSRPLDFTSLLESDTRIVDPLEYVRSVDYLVRLVLERVIRQKAKQRSIGTRDVTRGKHHIIDSVHTGLVDHIIASKPGITDELARAPLPLDNLDHLFDLNDDYYRESPLRQLVESLMEDFAANRPPAQLLI